MTELQKLKLQLGKLKKQTGKETQISELEAKIAKLEAAQGETEKADNIALPALRPCFYCGSRDIAVENGTCFCQLCGHGKEFRYGNDEVAVKRWNAYN